MCVLSCMGNITVVYPFCRLGKIVGLKLCRENVVLRNFIKQKACVYILKGPAHAADPFAPEIS